MDVRHTPSGLAGVGYILVLIGFVGALVTAAGVVVYTVVLPVVVDDHTITIQSDVPSSAVDSLPSNVELEARIPVKIELEDASVREGAVVLGALIVPILLATIVSYLLLRIADSVRKGDPFNMGNVRRLRTMGLTLLIGGPLGEFLSQILRQGLAESAGVTGQGLFIAIPGTLPLVGVGVLILGEVLGYGVRLREDVEGTV